MTSNTRTFPVASDPPKLDPLAHADAFMSRLRPPAEEDVPLLTEVVGQDAPPVLRSGLPPTVDQEALAAVLAEWLDTRLPEAVLQVLDGVADQLILKLTRDAEDDLLPRLTAALGKPQKPE